MSIAKLTKYPAYFEHNPDSTYTIRFRNWEGAFSQAENLEQAKVQANTLLLDVINSLIADNEIVPNVVQAQNGDYLIELPLDTQLKIALLNTLVETKCSKATLAKELNITPDKLSSYLSIKKTTNLEFLRDAFKYLGKDLSFTFNQ